MERLKQQNAIVEWKQQRGKGDDEEAVPVLVSFHDRDDMSGIFITVQQIVFVVGHPTICYVSSYVLLVYYDKG